MRRGWLCKVGLRLAWNMAVRIEKLDGKHGQDMSRGMSKPRIYVENKSKALLTVAICYGWPSVCVPR